MFAVIFSDCFLTTAPFDICLRGTDRHGKRTELTPSFLRKKPAIALAVPRLPVSGHSRTNPPNEARIPDFEFGLSTGKTKKELVNKDSERSAG
jgi:hypothetical protein